MDDESSRPHPQKTVLLFCDNSSPVLQGSHKIVFRAVSLEDRGTICDPSLVVGVSKSASTNEALIEGEAHKILQAFCNTMSPRDSFHHKLILSQSSLTDRNSRIAFLMRNGGRSLAPEGTVSSRELALNIGASLAHALSVMHEAGMGHNDVKPDNVLVDSRGIARLCDFGLATRFGNPMAGTLQFMPPEYRGHGQHPSSAAVDVWSLGMVLLLCVMRIRDQRKVPNALRAARSQHEINLLISRLVSCQGFKHEWVPILQWMLSFSPDTRPTAREVQKALEDLGRGGSPARKASVAASAAAAPAAAAAADADPGPGAAPAAAAAQALIATLADRLRPQDYLRKRNETPDFPL